YLVPRVAGRRWAEPIVARAVPWLERVGRPLGPFLPTRDPSRRTTLAAVLSGADTGALASAGEMAVVSGVLAFAHRPVKDLMTPRTAIVAIADGLPAAEAAHAAVQSLSCLARLTRRHRRRGARLRSAAAATRCPCTGPAGAGRTGSDPRRRPHARNAAW